MSSGNNTELIDRLLKRSIGNELDDSFSTICSRNDLRRAATAITELEAENQRLREVTERCQLTQDMPLEQLKELLEIDRKKGDGIWVIDRDILGNPCEIAGVVFITAVNGVALVAPYLADSGDLDCILQECIDETAKNMECDLLAYPLEDCFWSKEEAEQALKEDL